MKNIRVNANYLKNRELDNHRQRSIRKNCRVDERGNSYATINLFGCSKQLKLANIRLTLVIINLVVLVSAGISYFAWLDAKYNWQLSNVSRPGRNILHAMEKIPPLPNNVQETIKGVHCYLDQMLYMTSLNLFIYWAIYGIIISCRFGGACDICTIVVSVPHTILMIMWEIGVGVAVLRVNSILHSLPWENLQFTSSNNYRDLRYVEEFYRTWGPLVAISYFLCVPVQMLLVMLPFLITNLPFQNMDAEAQLAQHNATQTSAPSYPQRSARSTSRHHRTSISATKRQSSQKIWFLRSIQTLARSLAQRVRVLLRLAPPRVDETVNLCDASGEFVVKSSDVSVNLSVDSCPINDLPQKVPLNDMLPRKGPSFNLPQKVNPADLALKRTVNSDNVAAKKITPSLDMPASNVGENIGGEESEYVGMGDLPIITKSNLQNNPDDNDKDNLIDAEVASLYHCEMPHEKIQKVQTQNLFSRVRRVSWRGGQSAGRVVIDTMNRVYHVHSSGRPLWRLLDGQEITHPRLVEADSSLAGGASIYSSFVDNDYIDMHRGDPPPPYRLFDPNAVDGTCGDGRLLAGCNTNCNNIKNCNNGNRICNCNCSDSTSSNNPSGNSKKCGCSADNHSNESSCNNSCKKSSCSSTKPPVYSTLI